MPVTDINGEIIPLRHEMSVRDFQSIKCNWLYADFKSGYVYPDLRLNESEKLAHFLNEKACGPCYVHETQRQGHGAAGKLLHIILLHPDDRKNFVRDFNPEFWEFQSDSADKNAEVLAWQNACGFVYESPGMKRLMEYLSSLNLPVEIRAADVDGAARHLWPATGRTLEYTKNRALKFI